jgi:hypothetical protein
MYLLNTELDNVLAAIEQMAPDPTDTIMLLYSEHETTEIPLLVAALNERKISFFGAIFPGLIYGSERKNNGCIIQKFHTLHPPFLTTGISSAEFNGFPNQAPINVPPKGTAIILLDGLTPNIHIFLEKLNDLLGEQCNFIGAGAGSINLQQQPCVFCSEGFKADAAVVCVVSQQAKLGVRHGWVQLAGPLVATKTSGNTIFRLNWEPAIDVYRKIVEQDCGKFLTSENFGCIAQGYPFGIFREKDDDIVRDPLAIGENGEIICIGEVPTNTVLHVLKGFPDQLLTAAKEAMLDCAGGDPLPINAERTFVVDCITRTLFLDSEFSTEMNTIRENLLINQESQEPFGVLSLGEISSYGDGLLILFNKTIVIGSFN